MVAQCLGNFKLQAHLSLDECRVWVSSKSGPSTLRAAPGDDGAGLGGSRLSWQRPVGLSPGRKAVATNANPPSPHTWLFPCQSAFSSRWWLVPILTRNYKRRNDSFIEVVVRPAHAAIGPKVIIYVKLFFLYPFQTPLHPRSACWLVAVTCPTGKAQSLMPEGSTPWSGPLSG